MKVSYPPHLVPVALPPSHLVPAYGGAWAYTGPPPSHLVPVAACVVLERREEDRQNGGAVLSDQSDDVVVVPEEEGALSDLWRRGWGDGERGGVAVGGAENGDDIQPLEIKNIHITCFGSKIYLNFLK